MPIGQKFGGRRKGSRNKTTEIMQEWLERDLIGADSMMSHPALILLTMVNNKQEKPENIISAATALRKWFPQEIELSAQIEELNVTHIDVHTLKELLSVIDKNIPLLTELETENVNDQD